MEFYWAELLNSDWHDHLGNRSEDRLDNDDWLRKFLERWQWSSRETTLENARDSFHKLRALIARIVKNTIAGEEVSERDWNPLNSIMSSAPLIQQLHKQKNKYQLLLLPMKKNLDSILAEIAISFSQVFTEGDPARIRICENDDCRWVFYDHSKNKTRRWCDAGSCGNLMKVRRFRDRKKKESRKRKG